MNTKHNEFYIFIISHWWRSPGRHLAERLILHVATAVTPLPLVFLPIEQTADPLETVHGIVAQQVAAQSTVLQFDRFSQLTVAIFAIEMRVQPVHANGRQKIALLADALKARRT